MSFRNRESIKRVIVGSWDVGHIDVHYLRARVNTMMRCQMSIVEEVCVDVMYVTQK